MGKIIITPLSIKALKLYKEKSPSKYKDKYGDLDLDNIPKEYMKMGLFPNLRQDGTPETDSSGNPIMHEEEYFDSLQYKQDVTAKKPPTPLINGYGVPPTITIPKVEPTIEVVTDSHIGDELGSVDTNVDGGNTLEDNVEK